MRDVLKLIRVKHYIKNLLIFLPIFFSKNLFDGNNIWKVATIYIMFSLLCSIVYIINDIFDVEKDKKHPIKKTRPIASEKISKKQAITIAIILLIIVISIGIIIKPNVKTCIIIASYFILNILYSYKLKHIPIIDVTILAISLLLRIYIGAAIINVEVSHWLYLTMLSLAFYLGFVKRRNEIIEVKDNNTRDVLKKYNIEFLDKNMYMCLTLAIIFYSLWCLDMSKNIKYILFTIPITIMISMRYSLIIENSSMGDPTDVILKDKILKFSICIFAIILFIMIYI